VFHGHLFVMGELLSDSGMRNHPVTPMRDSNLIRLMNSQSRGKTGLISYAVIDQGVEAVVNAYGVLQKEGKRYGVVDSFTDKHLEILGKSVKELKLVTGGSGLAIGIARNWADKHSDQSDGISTGLPGAEKTVVLSGSCSNMTNIQVSNYIQNAPHYPLDVASCIKDPDYSSRVCIWVMENLEGKEAPIVYATADAETLQAIQNKFGAETASEAVEQFFKDIAGQLKEKGIKNFIVAGGETSGSVTQGLEVSGFQIGPQIAPGVPWVKSLDGKLSLALKSGNFGDPYFFSKAQEFFV
jgi:uncharacterized protein YgbK (DUF1537 family)